MDTVLGLSLTSQAVGWVLVEGREADGAIVDYDDFAVRTGGGARTVKTAERVTAAVLRARALAERRDQRIHVIGVTWSDDVAAEAALLLESLADAGFDNVVPVQLLRATDMLAQDVAPVFPQDAAQLEVARGAALAAACTEFTDARLVESINHTTVEPVPPRSRSYAGALTMLAAGAVMFVASLSLAVGPRLIPDRPSGPVERAVHKSASPPVLETPAPPPVAVAAPIAQAAPEPAPPEAPVLAAPPVEPQSAAAAEPPADLPAVEPAPPPPPVAPPPPPPEANPHPLLAKLLERLHGHQGDPAPEEPAPPPDPGVP